MDTMHIALATAPGSRHVNPGQPGKTNNQDAIAHRTFARGTVTVLCDGCGSQPHSGTGADIGAHLIAATLARHCSTSRAADLDWRLVTREITDALRGTAALFAASEQRAALDAAIAERFLFTAMVLIVEEETATIASFGDGVVIVDDDAHIIEPPVFNTPPYLGYLLLRDTAYHTNALRKHLAFAVVRTVRLAALAKGIVVGTDGLKELMEEDLHHPALVQPKALQRWLNVQTTERIAHGTFAAGKCSDDVSLVIMRTPAAQERLLEGRREVVDLKQEIARLQGSVMEITEAWNRTALERDAAEERVRALERDVERLTERAKKSDELEAAIAALSRDVGSLRGRVRRVRHPIMEIVRRFLSTSTDGSTAATTVQVAATADRRALRVTTYGPDGFLRDTRNANGA